MGDLIKIEAPREAHMLPSNFAEAREMAGAIARSNLFGCKTSEQAFALMLLADAEGLHPAAAARDYHIIDGKPSLKADAMLARYMAAGGKIKWLKREPECVSAEFTHASSGSVTITWDRERATLAGFWGKANWKKHPVQMLSARVISEGVRASFPGVVSGVYTPEEVQDFDSAAPPPRAAAPSPDAGLQVEVVATEAGAGIESQPAPVSPSMKASFTADSQDDGLGKGKSAYQAKKDGDWERVRDRLMEELKEFATRGAAIVWWEGVVATDEEYRALPQTFRKTFRDEFYIPHIETLEDEVEPEVVWEDAR